MVSGNPYTWFELGLVIVFIGIAMIFIGMLLMARGGGRGGGVILIGPIPIIWSSERETIWIWVVLAVILLILFFIVLPFILAAW